MTRRSTAVAMLLAVALSFPLTGCAGMARLLAPAAAPTVTAPEQQPVQDLDAAKAAARVVALKKSIIAVHEGLYLPAMVTLGALYDAGNPTVRAHATEIQTASEEYVKLKDDAAKVITVLGGAADQQVSALLALMLGKITALQRFRNQPGGAP